MQSVGIYIAVLTCDFRRNDKTLEGVATFMKVLNPRIMRCHVHENEEIKSRQLGSSLRGGTCGILRALRIPFGVRKIHVFVILNIRLI